MTEQTRAQDAYGQLEIESDRAFDKWERHPHDVDARKTAEKASAAWQRAGATLRVAMTATENARRKVDLYASDAEYARRLAIAKRHARVAVPHPA